MWLVKDCISVVKRMLHNKIQFQLLASAYLKAKYTTKQGNTSALDFVELL